MYSSADYELRRQSSLSQFSGFEIRKRAININWKFLFTDNRIRIFLVLLFAALIGVIVPIAIRTHYKAAEKENKCALVRELRVDCLPGIPLHKQNNLTCVSRGCCWNRVKSESPHCFHRHPTNYIYKVSSLNETNAVITSQIELQRAANLPSDLKIYSRVKVTANFLSNVSLRIQISPLNRTSYSCTSEYDPEKPYDPQHYLGYNITSESVENKSYEVKISNRNKRFSIKVLRSDSNLPLFDTSFGPLIIAEDLSQITTQLPSVNIYGMGQSKHERFRHDLTEPQISKLFTRSLNNTDSGSGCHPFYLAVEDTGNAHGVLLANIVPIMMVANGLPSVTFYTMSDSFDFFIFTGPSPSDVIRQLQKLVGRPKMPPYWALGHHSCRKSSLKDSYAIIQKLKKLNIPHESDCFSSDITNSLALYLNPSFNMKSISENFKTRSLKMLIHQTPYILNSSKEAVLANINTKYSNEKLFIKTFNSTYIGIIGNSEVNNAVLYPDFIYNEIGKVLEKNYKIFSKNSYLDGISLDMNSPVDQRIYEKMGMQLACSDNKCNKLTLFSDRSILSNRTICMDSLHSNNLPHYIFHNIYGHKHLTSISSAFTKTGHHKRIFLTSLSTYIGSGVYGGHWSGDSEASWKTLKSSVVKILDYSLYGIPLTGVPVCGFSGSTKDEQLCSRWMQVAAFQPLTITFRADSKNVILLGRSSSIARTVLSLRYALIPYLYTLFYKANTNGDTVIRPLFFEFPNDQKTFGIDEQFLVGPAILVSPVFHPNVRSINAYFPGGCWYDMSSGESVDGTRLVATEHDINLHVRGGYIIFTHKSSNTTIFNTKNARRRPFSLVVAIDCFKSSKLNPDDGIEMAKGEVYLDDGETNDIPKSKYHKSDDVYLFIEVTVIKYRENTTIHFEPFPKSLSSAEYFANLNISLDLDVIHIFGMKHLSKQIPTALKIDNQDYPLNNFVYNIPLDTAILKNIRIALNQPHAISWA